MRVEKTDNRIIIKNLIDLINDDFNLKLNIKIIKKNCEILSNKYLLIEKIWNDIEINYDYIFLKELDEEFTDVMKIVKNNYLSTFNYYNKFIENINSIIKLSYKNIIFYYINKNDNFNKKKNEKVIINRLFKESVVLSEFAKDNFDHDIIILWIPVDKDRNFKYDNIEKINESTKNFEAFTASGLTYGDYPRITIISRYEEVDKLLFHELIHNLYLDGTKHHENVCKHTENEYKTIKNNNNYNYEYAIYESYTELLSSYLNLIFKNIINNFDYNNKQNIIEKLCSQVIIELFYSYNVICNLIHINGYTNFKEFINNVVFKGNICFYEYYFLKALMYNNYILEDNNNMNNTINNYKKIINITKKDNLLETIYNKGFIKNENFSYIFFK
jgi:hypothetical protein